MRPSRVLFLLLVIGISVGSGYLLRVLAEPDHQPKAGSATPRDGPRLEAVTFREESPGYRIDLRYPRLGTDADLKIKGIVDSAVASIKTCDPACARSASGKYSLTGDFDSAYLGPDVISIRFVLSSYTGGAHGGQTIYGLNFDSATSRELTLEDAVSMIGIPISQLADQAKQQLSARLGQSFLFPEGALPDAKNYQTFLVSAGEVTFIFQEYQVAPYAAGPQEVSFFRKIR